MAFRCRQTEQASAPPDTLTLHSQPGPPVAGAGCRENWGARWAGGSGRGMQGSPEAEEELAELHTPGPQEQVTRPPTHEKWGSGAPCTPPLRQHTGERDRKRGAPPSALAPPRASDRRAAMLSLWC